MLLAYTGRGPARQINDPHPPREIPDAIWFDLLDATEQERALAERATGLRVPTREEIEEIENSSRLRAEGKTLYLSTPLSYRLGEASAVSPVGFVLSPDHLLTVRFAKFPVFEACLAQQPVGNAPSSAAVFVGLLEAIVDRLADVLERAGGELDALSSRIFHAEAKAHRRRVNNDAPLRAMLRDLGRTGDLISNVRDTLLGLLRIVLYVNETAAGWTPEDLRSRYNTLRRDAASLSDYDAQLTNKVQFLLDATLGFINIDQNNGIKVLTVVSLIGIPPTLIASIYGMNFKIPELSWAWGYPYALTLMVLSVALPLGWFKLRGWF